MGGSRLMLAARRLWARVYTRNLEMREGVGRAMKVMVLLEMRDDAGHGAAAAGACTLLWVTSMWWCC